MGRDRRDLIADAITEAERLADSAHGLGRKADRIHAILDTRRTTAGIAELRDRLQKLSDGTALLARRSASVTGLLAEVEERMEALPAAHILTGAWKEEDTL